MDESDVDEGRLVKDALLAYAKWIDSWDASPFALWRSAENIERSQEFFRAMNRVPDSCKPTVTAAITAMGGAVVEAENRKFWRMMGITVTPEMVEKAMSMLKAKK